MRPLDKEFVAFTASMDVEDHGGTLVLGLMVSHSVEPGHLFAGDRRVVDCPDIVVTAGYGPDAPEHLKRLERVAWQSGAKMLVIRAPYFQSTRELLLEEREADLPTIRSVTVKQGPQ